MKKIARELENGTDEENKKGSMMNIHKREHAQRRNMMRLSTDQEKSIDRLMMCAKTNDVNDDVIISSTALDMIIIRLFFCATKIRQRRMHFVSGTIVL